MRSEQEPPDPELPGESEPAQTGLLPWRGTGLFVLLAVWVLSAAYVFPYRNRGWIPHDEGILGQSAERVLHGELPHRDFPEIYTGGLTYWNALAFRLFGVRLTSLRVMLYLSFLAFVPAVFGIASRFGPPLAAAAVTLLAVVWSLPNYFAAIPSWYNLFLEAWALLALLRHVETGQRRWIFLAGLFAGISCLFKVIGVYVIAASLLFLLYREGDFSDTPGRPAKGRRVSAYFFFLTGGLALFLGVLFLVVRTHLRETEFLFFLAPAATICGLLLWREWTEGRGSFLRRLRSLISLALPLAAGAMLPTVLFLIPFALKDALGDFWRGVIAGTGAHVQFVKRWLPGPSMFLPALPYTVVLAAGSLRRLRFVGGVLLLVGGVLAAALWLSGSSPDVYQTVWFSAQALGASAVFAACLRLADSHRLGSWSPFTRQRIFLLASVVALTGLVQFPFATPIYFVYFAPLIALLIFALVGSESRPPQLLHGMMLTFYLLFAALRTNPGYVYRLGKYFERYDPPALLDLPRAGGLRVIAGDAEAYGTLIPLVEEKSGGKAIYSGPECPEVHFLSGLEEAAPRDSNAPRDPMLQPEELFRSLEAEGSRAVVLNSRPWLTKALPPKILGRMEQLFPNSREVGSFVVRWRD